MTKEEQIQNFMTKLHISYEEAEQLYEDDDEDYIGEEGEAMTEKAKDIKTYVGGDKKERKPREKKIDGDKLAIIQSLFEYMSNGDYKNLTIKNDQKEITFSLYGSEYSLNLVKHRPNKK